MFKERGELLLLKFADSLKDVGALEGMPKMEGKRMLVMFAPRTQKPKKGSELGRLIKEDKEPKEAPASDATPPADASAAAPTEDKES